MRVRAPLSRASRLPWHGRVSCVGVRARVKGAGPTFGGVVARLGADCAFVSCELPGLSRRARRFAGGFGMLPAWAPGGSLYRDVISDDFGGKLEQRSGEVTAETFQKKFKVVLGHGQNRADRLCAAQLREPERIRLEPLVSAEPSRKRSRRLRIEAWTSDPALNRSERSATLR
jgi:hypothetical protein